MWQRKKCLYAQLKAKILQRQSHQANTWQAYKGQAPWECDDNHEGKAQLYMPLTRTLRHSWWEDPAGGQDVPSRKSCCLKVPSSLALHTTLGFPTSTYNQKEAGKVTRRKGKRETVNITCDFLFLSSYNSIKPLN